MNYETSILEIRKRPQCGWREVILKTILPEEDMTDIPPEFYFGDEKRPQYPPNTLVFGDNVAGQTKLNLRERNGEKLPELGQNGNV